ncbi:MAG: PSD1 and planctomycete cytochrome C domain-containing protein [Saprospiraceae bacterium]|nr:PSD1 and planctomycete cytochrome C domain-containing protein [Saprospiraceae bacterium]
MNKYKFNRFVNFQSPLLVFLILIAYSCQFTQEENDVVQENPSIPSETIPEIIDFNFHIKPILSDRCFKCHGPDKSKIEAGLSFVDFESATKALGEQKDQYAIVPGNVLKSNLIHRINTADPAEVMPPPESNLVLNVYEKKLLEKWVEQGATYKKHWALLPIENRVPEINPTNFVNNDIDKFIVNKIEGQSLAIEPIARKEYLLRRISFTLTGLPPSIDEIDRFLEDDSEDAYAGMVDYYLEQDAYGEHMATDWLDLARYADTHGYQDDLERTMWPWRDWVIHSFNQNMAYDDFVSYQLAGDLLPEASREQIIATAFNRNHSITQEGGVIPEEYRTEYVADRTMTFGKAFLGMSVECARCHDHKYDPITQKDYYSLFAFFNNVPEKGLIEEYGAIPEPYIEIRQGEIDSVLHFINNLDTLSKIPLLVMEEMPKPRETFILDRGMYNKPTEKVEPNVPASILDFADYPKNRKGLAMWLFDSANPLTARVAVNRLWQKCFGNGLVSTSDDFGAQGALPSHPELLDHLAFTFMKSDWDIKYMLKYILMSQTFQRSSKSTKAALEKDPENRWYARAPRTRLTAENIRDHILETSDLLVHTMGGPSVKPYQPPGLWKEKTGGGGGSTSEYKIDEGDQRFRRSLYTFWKRTVPPPSMMTFDAVSRDFCMVKRETTSTPLQALVMMNNPEIIEASIAMASRSMNEFSKVDERISFMFLNATSRSPEKVEVDYLSDYLNDQITRLNKNEALAEEYLSNTMIQLPSSQNRSELAAYGMLASIIYNLDETLTKS